MGSVRTRVFGWVLLALVGVSGIRAFESIDNVFGVQRMRQELIEAAREDRLAKTKGPWTIRYVGPLEEGGTVAMEARPAKAFQTTRMSEREFEVRVKNWKQLCTSFNKELRPIGVQVIRGLGEPGEGRITVTFQTKKGTDLKLSTLKQRGMIQSFEWFPRHAATFLGYRGVEAGFRREPGQENTPVEVRLTVREESTNFHYWAWLPRTGEGFALADPECRKERVFKNMKTVDFRTPWMEVDRFRDRHLAAQRAADKVWMEIHAHCEETMMGEILQERVKMRFDCPDQPGCEFTKSCKCSASAKYTCKIREYETVDLCNMVPVSYSGDE